MPVLFDGGSRRGALCALHRRIRHPHSVSQSATTLSTPGVFPPPDSLEFSPVPAWTIEADIPAAESGTERACLLLQDTQESPARGEVSCRRVLQLPGREPGKKARIATFDWNPWRHTLCVHEVLLRRGVEVIGVVSAGVEPEEEHSEVSQLPDGMARLSIPLPVRAGDLVETSWTLRNRLEGDTPGDRVFLAGDALAVTEWRHSLRLPADAEIPRHASHRMEISPQQETQDGEVELTWLVRRMDRADTTPALPPWVPPLPWVEVSGWKSWPEVSAVFRRRWDTALKGSVSGGAAVLRGNPKGTRETLTAALRHVQDEVSLIPGSAGMPLRSADEILKSGRATAAEKALLFAALIRKMKAKVDVTPHLASTGMRHGVVDLLPGLEQFDRVLLRVQAGTDTFLLDPASEGQGGALEQHAVPACGYALPVTEQMGSASSAVEHFFRIPAPPKGRDRILLHEVWRPDAASGAISLDWTLTFHGRCADEQRRLLRHGAAPVLATLLPSLQRDFPDIEPEAEEELHDEREANMLTVRGKAGAPRWGRAETSGGRQFFRSMHALAGAIQVEADSIRRLPLAVHLDGPLRLEHSLTLHAAAFPALRGGQKIVTGKWLRLQRDERLESGALHARCELDVTSAVLEPGEIRAWKLDAERAGPLLDFAVVLPGYAGKSGSVSRLRTNAPELTLEEEDQPPAQRMQMPRAPSGATGAVEPIRREPRPREAAKPSTASDRFVAATVIEGDPEEAAVRAGTSHAPGAARRFRLHSGPKRRLRAVPVLAGLSVLALIAALAVIVLKEKKKRPEGITPDVLATAGKVAGPWDEAEKALAEGDTQRADALFTKAELHPHDPVLLMAKRARIALMRGETELAGALASNALNASADCAEAHAVAGEVHFSRGRFREAAAGLERGIPDGGGTARQWQVLAQSQLHLDKPEAAETSCRTAWRLAGESPRPDLARLLGTLLLRRSAGAEAVSLLATAAAANPGNSALQLEYATVLVAAGELRKAADALTVAEQASPGDPAVQIHHALILAKQQQFTSALKRLEGVQPPPDPVMHGLLSEVYSLCGEKARALSAAEQQCRLDPFDAAARFRLGSLLEMSGQTKDALAQLMRAAELDPSALGTLEALASLAEKAGELSIAGQTRARITTLRSGKQTP